MLGLDPATTPPACRLGMDRTRQRSLAYLPVEKGACARALQLVEKADSAYERLVNADDSEALHDFRVAVRQLRTLVRTYDPYLTIGKKRRQALRRLAKKTSTARDLEVTLDWLSAQRGALDPSERMGLDHLMAKLKQRCEHAYGLIRKRVPSEWNGLEAGLVKRLGRGLPEQPESGTFAQVSAVVADRYCDELESALRTLNGTMNNELAHQVRICGKRLRYVLEPFRKAVDGAQEAAVALKRLQDDLGALCDSHVATEELMSSTAAMVGERARRLVALELASETENTHLESEKRRDVMPGLLALARLAKARHTMLSAKVKRRHLASRTLISGIRKVTKRLRAIVAPKAPSRTKPQVRHDGTTQKPRAPRRATARTRNRKS